MTTNPKKTDPRILRTRQLLRQAIIHLIEEKGFEAVKIQDITDYATVNKTTFYLHYQDKEDLLIQSTYEILDELDRAIGLPTITAEAITPEFLLNLLTTVFEHFAKHADFYRIILNKIGTPPVMEAIQKPIEAIVQRWLMRLQKGQTAPLVEFDVLIPFISGGFIGLLRGWLNQEQRRTSQDIARQLLNIIVLGAFRSAGLPNPDI